MTLQERHLKLPQDPARLAALCRSVLVVSRGSTLSRTCATSWVETVIYGVAQEALTNAVGHSRGRRIGVRLAFEAGRVRLTVSDNGIGLPAILQVQSLGLTGMRERARLVDGRLEVSSPPGQGVRVTLTVPTQESAAG